MPDNPLPPAFVDYLKSRRKKLVAKLDALETGKMTTADWNEATGKMEISTARETEETRAEISAIDAMLK